MSVTSMWSVWGFGKGDLDLNNNRSICTSSLRNAGRDDWKILLKHAVAVAAVVTHAVPKGGHALGGIDGDASMPNNALRPSRSSSGYSPSLVGYVSTEHGEFALAATGGTRVVVREPRPVPPGPVTFRMWIDGRLATLVRCQLL